MDCCFWNTENHPRKLRRIASESYGVGVTPRMMHVLSRMEYPPRLSHGPSLGLRQDGALEGDVVTSRGSGPQQNGTAVI